MRSLTNVMIEDHFEAFTNIGGDAFRFTRCIAGRHRRYLIDGGEDSATATLLRRVAPAVGRHSRLDVAVCTHGDSDHTSGALALLEAFTPPREVWVPSVWAAVIDGLLQPDDFVQTIANELAEHVEVIEELFGRPDARPHLGDVVDQLVAPRDAGKPSDVHGQDLRDARDAGNGRVYRRHAYSAWSWGPYHQSAELLARRREIAAQGGGIARMSQTDLDRLLVRAARNAGLTASAELMLRSLIDAARRIARIVYLASLQLVEVRWFDYDLFIETGLADGGDLDYLLPVNAVEVGWSAPVGVSPLTALFYSLSNERCLVFRAPGTPGRATELLLCGDSRLRFDDLVARPDRWIGRSPDSLLVTAPHHGTASADSAYPVIQRWAMHAPFFARGTSWRTAGSGTAGPAYLTIRGSRGPTSRRACTRCPTWTAGPPARSSDVTACGVDGAWVPGLTGWGCACP